MRLCDLFWLFASPSVVLDTQLGHHTTRPAQRPHVWLSMAEARHPSTACTTAPAITDDVLTAEECRELVFMHGAYAVAGYRCAREASAHPRCRTAGGAHASRTLAHCRVYLHDLSPLHLTALSTQTASHQPYLARPHVLRARAAPPIRKPHRQLAHMSAQPQHAPARAGVKASCVPWSTGPRSPKGMADC